MKVLKPGKKGTDWTIQHACTGWGNGGKGCDALLEVEKKDLRYFKGVSNPGSWGDSDPAVCFKCPVCGVITDLGLNDAPRDKHKLTTWTSAWQNGEVEIND